MLVKFRIGWAVVALGVAPALMAQTKMPSNAEPMTGTFLSVQASNQFLSSQLVGLPVYVSANEKIGMIGDLVIDQSGAIQAVVIAVGGFLGVGAKDIAVSMKSVTILRDGTGIKRVSGYRGPRSNSHPASSDLPAVRSKRCHRPRQSHNDGDFWHSEVLIPFISVVAPFCELNYYRGSDF